MRRFSEAIGVRGAEKRERERRGNHFPSNCHGQKSRRNDGNYSGNDNRGRMDTRLVDGRRRGVDKRGTRSWLRERLENEQAETPAGGWENRGAGKKERGGGAGERKTEGRRGESRRAR